MTVSDLLPSSIERPVAILAHPDDESLWCAGLLAASQPFGWTIICCSIPDRDPDRAYRFFNACDVIGAKPRLLPYRESEGLHIEEIDLSGYDFILTHGAAGEYGHRHHKEIHEFIAARATVPVRFIGYGGPGKYKVKLDEGFKERKLRAIRCYDGVRPNGQPQYELLLANYGNRFDLWMERYD